MKTAVPPPTRCCPGEVAGRKVVVLPRFSRRAVPLVGLLALLLLVTTAPAGAIVGWCSKDPVVQIGSTRANIWVSSPEEILQAVKGPTRVKVTVPEGVPTELIATDDGFGWDPAYEVEFYESNRLEVTNLGIQVKVVVQVPANADLPVLVEIADRDGDVLDSLTGVTNVPIVIRTRI